MSFVNEFCAAYLRNNRSGGRKNIRCFPSCSPKGHTSSGFCGEHLMLKVNVPEDAICLAEFMLAGTEATDFAIGTEHKAKTIESLTRTKSKPLERFLKGLLTTFPRDGSRGFQWKPTCYHYGFRSNKHSTLKQHMLRAYVLCPIESSQHTFKVTKIIDTPSFSLFSSKKLDKLKPASPAKEEVVILGAMSTPPMAPKSKEGLIMSDIPLMDDECTPPPTPPQDPSGKRPNLIGMPFPMKKETKSRRYAGKRTSGAISEALAFQKQSKEVASLKKKRKAVSQPTATRKTKAKSTKKNKKNSSTCCACCCKLDTSSFCDTVPNMFDDWVSDPVDLDYEFSVFPEATAFPLAVESEASLLDAFEGIDNILSLDF